MASDRKFAEWRKVQIKAWNREKERENLAGLRGELARTRRARIEATARARSKCRSERARLVSARARERADIRRAREALKRRASELRERYAKARVKAAELCRARLERAGKLGDDERKARAELRAERALLKTFAADLKRERLAAKTKRKERRSESDDEVRANLPRDLLPVFERYGKGLKSSSFRSRAEAFMHWAEEHPDLVLEAQAEHGEGLADADIRELMQREAELQKQIDQAGKRKRTTRDDDVPF